MFVCSSASDLHRWSLSNLSVTLVLLHSVKKGGLGGMFGMLKGLVGSKSLTRDDMDPVLEKMKDHLIGTSGSMV